MITECEGLAEDEAPARRLCQTLAGALDRSVPERLDRRVDQLVITRQRCLDEPGPLVGEHLDLAGFDGVEGLLGEPAG
jgi:hypothetical protein